jgi:hypothetical protein
VKARRPSVLASATIALLAVAGLGACTSEPSVKRVTEDVIESLDVDAAVRDCMLEVVDGYTNEELEAMGVENADFTSTNPDVEGASPEFQEFVNALGDCNA